MNKRKEIQNNKPTILLFYKYVNLENPEQIMNQMRIVMEALGMKGRILLGKEGINGTCEGGWENCKKYIEYMNADARFSDLVYKKSEGNGEAFPKLKIKVRNEIVASGLGEDVNPLIETGAYLSPEELHTMYENNEDFVMIDMRNSEEIKSGHFDNTIDPGLVHFRDLKEKVKDLSHLKDKKIVTSCTGGIRCEKASAFLIKEGFKDVSQLHGGMHCYMEKFPKGYFKGSLYVFDERVTIATDPEHDVVGTCTVCGCNSEHYEDCSHTECPSHIIVCESCYEKNRGVWCTSECKAICDKKVAMSV